MRYRVETQRQGSWGSMGWCQTGYWEPGAPDPAINDPSNVGAIGEARLCSPKLALSEAWARLGLDTEKMVPSDFGEWVPDCTYTCGFRFRNKVDVGTDEIQLYAEECDSRVSLVPIGSELDESIQVMTTLNHEDFPLTTTLERIAKLDERVQGQYVGVAFRWIMAQRDMTFTQFMGRSHMLKRVRGILYGTEAMQDRNRRYAYVEHIAEYLGYWVILSPNWHAKLPGEIEINLITEGFAEQDWFDEVDDRHIKHYPLLFEDGKECLYVFRAPTRLEEAVEVLEGFGLGLYIAPIGSKEHDELSMLRCREVES